MSRPVDERFLTVHPRTLQWWEERKKCRQCAHLKITPFDALAKNVKAGGGMVCSAIKRASKYSQDMSCIMARDGQCGPNAVLFKEKT